MAHFYGTVQGGRGKGSRLGHKSTGLVTTAATWSHTVTAALEYDEATGRDMLSVCISAKDGSDVRCLYSGFLDGKGNEAETVYNMEPTFTLDEIQAAHEEIAGK